MGEMKKITDKQEKKKLVMQWAKSIGELLDGAFMDKFGREPVPTDEFVVEDIPEIGDCVISCNNVKFAVVTAEGEVFGI